MNIFHTHHLPGRTVSTVEGKEYLFFSGTDYLGMGHNEHYRRFIQEGLLIYGNHYGSSRNNSLRLGIYEETEQALANFVGAPSSLIVSSGMWAGQLVMKLIEGIVGTEVQYHYAPRVHPAIWGNKYQGSNGSWKNWAAMTVGAVKESKPDTAHLICTDAIGSPFVEDYDFSVFDELAGKQNIWLIVDDSHSLGVRGENGKGIFFELNAKIGAGIIVVSSLNKALGIPGGVIFADESVTERLRNSPWFAGASPTAPVFMYALKQLLNACCFEESHDLLMNNIVYLKERLGSSTDFAAVKDYPVLCSTEVALFEYLLDNGIMASCFAYPSPSDPAVARLAISALHQKKDLDHLAEVCIKFYN